MLAEQHVFIDRRDAGKKLATVLAGLKLRDPVVLALPRGGVPVAFEISKALRAPLDLVLVRKIGAPRHPEPGLGAVVDGAHPQRVINNDLVAELRVPASYLEAQAERQLQEIERRRRSYLGDRPPMRVEGRTVI